MAKKKKNLGGRPTIMTEMVVKKLEEAFAMGCTDIEACLYAGIDRKNLYNYQQRNPEFLLRKEELKETPILKARASVINGLHEHEFALKFLERKKKDEFSLRTELTGAEGNAIKTENIDLKKLSDEQLAQLTAIIESASNTEGKQ